MGDLYMSVPDSFPVIVSKVARSRHIPEEEVRAAVFRNGLRSLLPRNGVGPSMEVLIDSLFNYDYQVEEREESY
ncbi:MAG: hypothetical protein KKG75_02015 [Nanoarchaeota archaeon]|nr:hypothetical protein [Nanoarchaeota archaeon]